MCRDDPLACERKEPRRVGGRVSTPLPTEVGPAGSIANPVRSYTATGQQKVSRQTEEPTPGTEAVAFGLERLPQNAPIQPGAELQVNKKTDKSSKTIRANKRKAKLRAKRRRQRAPAAG